jgi:beta-aspartyl-peptidase (threonine type)
MKQAIIVHGGAGAWDLAAETIKEAIAVCAEAAEVGRAVLIRGGAALDAVEEATRVLEDSPVLDAGRGSYLNAVGEVEMDALIMDGRTLELGAIAAVQRVRNPIVLARKVMEETEHSFLVGQERDMFLALKEREGYKTIEIFSEPGAMGDTVGAVALDDQGNLACGTSTGGTRKKLPGRVGDSPLVGSGGYADNQTAAVSATGYGEALMKVVISKRVCDLVGDGLSSQLACEASIRLLKERVDGLGGVVAIDRHGQVGIAFNTAAMPHAYAIGDGVVHSSR